MFPIMVTSILPPQKTHIMHWTYMKLKLNVLFSVYEQFRKQFVWHAHIFVVLDDDGRGP